MSSAFKTSAIHTHQFGIQVLYAFQCLFYALNLCRVSAQTHPMLQFVHNGIHRGGIASPPRCDRTQCRIDRYAAQTGRPIYAAKFTVGALRFVTSAQVAVYNTCEVSSRGNNLKPISENEARIFSLAAPRAHDKMDIRNTRTNEECCDKLVYFTYTSVFVTSSLSKYSVVL
jgi:hypothetical protein